MLPVNNNMHCIYLILCHYTILGIPINQKPQNWAEECEHQNMLHPLTEICEH
uniref:Uncharacterized protein n=1 Tax=Rhizophora mucronata TaxID=61149 RepID=A0A2P2QHC6_RHIMU